MQCFRGSLQSLWILNLGLHVYLTCEHQHTYFFPRLPHSKTQALKFSGVESLAFFSMWPWHSQIGPEFLGQKGNCTLFNQLCIRCSVCIRLSLLIFMFWAFRYTHVQLRSLYPLSTFNTAHVTKKYQALLLQGQLGICASACTRPFLEEIGYKWRDRVYLLIPSLCISQCKNFYHITVNAYLGIAWYTAKEVAGIQDVLVSTFRCASARRKWGGPQKDRKTQTQHHDGSSSFI